MSLHTYFKQNQKQLLNIANSSVGRFLLSTVDKEFLDNREIIKLTPNSIHVQNAAQVYQVYFIGSGNSMYVANKLIPLLEKLKLAKVDSELAYAHFSGLHINPKYPQIFLANSTYNTVAGGGGSVFVAGEATWAAVRNAITGSAGGAINIRAEFDGISYYGQRNFYPFLTSSLTGAIKVTAAFLKIYRDDTQAAFTNDDSTSLELIQTTQASTSTVVGTDYDNVTFTSGGSLAFSATANNTYAQLDFDVSALPWINSTGNTKLGIITGRDLNNSAPTGHNTLGSSISGANPEVLSVTYQAGGAFIL